MSRRGSMGLGRMGLRGRQRPQQQRLAVGLSLLLLAWLCLLRGAEAFVLGGRQAAVSASPPPAASKAGPRPKSPAAAQLHAIAVEQPESQARQHQQHHHQAVATAPAAAAAAGEAPSAHPQDQQSPHHHQQQQPSFRTKLRIAGRDLRSPFVAVEIRPATRLEELLAVIDLRAECFAAQAGPLSVEAKLKHVKHVLARRARGAVVLVATARDLLSPFSGEVIVGSLECSTHEFEEGSPFVHDGPPARKLYLTEMAVKPAFRRQGIATSLLRAVDGLAAKTQAEYVCLFCEAGNRGAIGLYQGSGFYPVDYSPTVDAFAASLGLPTTKKPYAFLYKPLSQLKQQQQQQQQQKQQQQQEDDDDGNEVLVGAGQSARSRSAAASAAGGSLVPAPVRALLAGQPGLLGLGKRAFSWW